ncbi:hypothetical protein NE579_16085, partial [Intestinimonas massiliensis]
PGSIKGVELSCLVLLAGGYPNITVGLPHYMLLLYFDPFILGNLPPYISVFSIEKGKTRTLKARIRVFCL